MTETIVGMRFAAKDLPRITELVGDYESGQREGGAMLALLRRAATATALGDPVIFHCVEGEAEQFADGLTLYGLQRPAIEAVPAL